MDLAPCISLVPSDELKPAFRYIDDTGVIKFLQVDLGYYAIS